MTDRRRLLALLIGAVVVSAVVGWAAGSRIRSPAEVAARTAAPAASPILVPAEQRVLSADVVTRGTSRFGSPQELSLAPSALKSRPGVAARMPLAGTELREGDVVFTTSGRPVFLLAGLQPAFRDLGPGIEGDDVRQLEEALGRMGFDPGPADGTYDASTEAAVAAWYEQAGFEPFTASTEQLAAVRALEASRNSARIDVITAQGSVAIAEAALGTAEAAHARALDASGRSASSVEAAVARAAAQNEAARADVAAKQAVVDALRAGSSVIPPTPAAVAAAEADLALAQSNAEVTRLAGEQAVAEATATGTPTDVANARTQADAANRAAAADIAAKRAALDAVRAGTPGTAPTPGEIAAAKADLATTRGNAEIIRLGGERDIAEAQAAEAAARGDTTSTSGDVQAAQAALGHANAALGVWNGQANLVASDLGLARLRAGVQVPADEVIFVVSTPVRVAEQAAPSSVDLTSGPRITVTDAVVAVDGSLRLEEAQLVKPGMRVTIDEPDLGVKASGVVRRVAEAPGTNGVDGFHVYFEVIVDGAPPSLVGASVRMTVPVESTGGSVLAVPVSALTLSADGSSRIQRQHNGALEFVTVEPGLSAGGFVAVKLVAGALEPGDLVVVGFDQQGATAQ